LGVVNVVTPVESSDNQFAEQIYCIQLQQLTISWPSQGQSGSGTNDQLSSACNIETQQMLIWAKHH